jgi:predicted CoA-substrate-specific enzyme activase
MKAVGLDIGSMTTKAVVLDGDKISSSVIVASGEEVESTARDAVEQVTAACESDDGADLYVVSTGIGGKSVSLSKQQKSVTTCLARGIHNLFPSARMLIDMGAESITIVKLNERGRISDWLGHDKCAAGTGIFLQQMAKLMQMPLEEMATLSLKAKAAADITSTCAVFAESEVISHVHRDPPTPREDIVAGIYSSLVSRVMALAKRVGIEKDVAVSGGVALNVGLINTLEKELGFKVLVPEKPQLVAALGAAIVAGENIARA